MGKKYLLEIEENKDGVFAWSSFAPYIAPDLEQVRMEAYEKGYKAAKHECEDCPKQAYTDTLRMDVYRKGLEDAWDAARKVTQVRKYGGYGDCLEEVFGRHRVPWDVFDYSASECIEKIRAYEQAQKEKEEQIQVGDEVIPRETEYDTMIVTRLWKDGYDSDCIDAIGFDGRIGSFLMSRVSKTGKHCEIAEVLQKMKKS